MVIEDHVLLNLYDKNKEKQDEAKKAALKLKAFDSDYRDIKKWLEYVRKKIINELNAKEDDAPYRITYEVADLKLYVDFVIDTQIQNSKYEVLGNIVFGAFRYSYEYKTVRTVSTIDETTNGSTEHKKESKISVKCQEKPILKFIIDEDGHITSEDNYKDKIWDCENDQDISEICIFALEGILTDAYLWKNENLIPK